MALLSFFKNKFSKSDRQNMQYVKMLNGYSPVFSQFGHNIYASDVVQMCIDAIATECSKLQPRHIRIDSNGIQTTPKSSLNRLFKFSPNQLMTTRDFLEKIIWLLYMNYNAFIYPMFDVKTDAGGNVFREYTAFYPLNPTTVTFLQDANNKLFVEMRFANGDSFTLAYSDVIHLRKRFSVNDIMGGGMDGQPDNAALLKVLTINDTILQGLEKAIKTGLSIRGVLKINTMLDDEKQKAEREKLEAAIDSGNSSIVALDLKGDYIPLNPDPKLIDDATMRFIQDKILYWYGTPLKILSGDFNDEDYQAWYEKTLETIVIGLGQAFSKTVFTQRELDFGNQIVCYHRDMMYLSTKSKLELLKTAGEQGLLTDDQKLRILGYPPLPDGSGVRRTISLNYVSTDIADEYQMTKAKNGTLNKEPGSNSSQRAMGLGGADYRSVKITISDKDGDGREELKKVKQVIKSLTKAEKKELGPRYFYDDSQYRAFKMDGEKPVAFIENRLTGKKGHLNAAVHPDYRGKGHAKALIKKVIKDAPDLGAEKIYWITTPGNEASRKLAEKVGFVLKNEDEDEARYVLDLED